MLKLWHAPKTRSVRVLWLLEELGLDYELENVNFEPTSTRFFQQDTPLGKLPVLEDGDIILCESGAIIEYILERYGEDRLAPPIGDPKRAAFLQWLHFAESTAFPPIGFVVWLTRYRQEGEDLTQLTADARERAVSGLSFAEEQLGDKSYLLGDTFSAADIMLGFTLGAAFTTGILDDRFPKLGAYFGRLMQRPALIAALAD